jgi:hypothetical protein
MMGGESYDLVACVLALADGGCFGGVLFKAEGLTAKKLEAAVKEVGCVSGACSVVSGLVKLRESWWLHHP